MPHNHLTVHLQFECAIRYGKDVCIHVARAPRQS